MMKSSPLTTALQSALCSSTLSIYTLNAAGVLGTMPGVSAEHFINQLNFSYDSAALTTGCP